jgi:hypothetical protein
LAAVEATDCAIDGTVSDASREDGRPGRWVNALLGAAPELATGSGWATGGRLADTFADLVLAGATAGGVLVALAGAGGLLELTDGIFTLEESDLALAFGTVLETGFAGALAATLAAALAGEDLVTLVLAATFTAFGLALAGAWVVFVVFPVVAFTYWLLAGSSSTGCRTRASEAQGVAGVCHPGMIALPADQSCYVSSARECTGICRRFRPDRALNH